MLYVRHAHNFLKSGFKLLYVLTFVALGIYILNRNINWTFLHLFDGPNLRHMPKGIFCMEKNLTEVIEDIKENIKEDQRKEFFLVTSYRGKMFIITNTLLHDGVGLYCLLASLKAR